jgi:uncharacterized protein
MSLLLDVSSLERDVGQGIPFQLTGPPPEIVDLPDGVVLGPVSVLGRVIWTGHTVLIEGRVRAGAFLVCSRCLRSIERPVEAALSREFKATDEDQGKAGERANRGHHGRKRGGDNADVSSRWESEEPAGGENESPLPFSHQTVDLTFPVREALVLELPMKPVCRDDCAGLCPVCGTDLNEKACGCRAEKADTRFLSLKKLLEAEERRE